MTPKKWRPRIGDLAWLAYGSWTVLTDSPLFYTGAAWFLTCGLWVSAERTAHWRQQALEALEAPA